VFGADLVTSYNTTSVLGGYERFSLLWLLPRFFRISGSRFHGRCVRMGSCSLFFDQDFLRLFLPREKENFTTTRLAERFGNQGRFLLGVVQRPAAEFGDPIFFECVYASSNLFPCFSFSFLYTWVSCLCECYRHGAIYSNDIILKVQYAVFVAREIGGCEVVVTRLTDED